MKYIAIMRDGFSDYCVIKYFVSAVFKHHYQLELKDDNFFDMESLNITDAVAKYVSNSDKKKDCGLYTQHAEEFKTRIVKVLYAASVKFKRERKDAGFSNKDILVMYSDAEKMLKDKHNYFKDWAYTLNAVLRLSVETFYDTMVRKGFNYENLPLILPLILFPSSEILAASCMFDFNRENFRELKAKPALKQKVYGTDNIPSAIKTGKLDEVLSNFIVPESLKDVYREIPESRKLIQILSHC
jgi:hypothetical protein